MNIELEFIVFWKTIAFEVVSQLKLKKTRPVRLACKALFSILRGKTHPKNGI
jgi:hypothetical protein